MTKPVRHGILIGMLLMLLACSAFWTWGQLGAARDHAQARANQTQACRDLAQAIEELRRPSTWADTADVPLEQIHQIVAAAASASGLTPESALLGIEPRVGRPLKDNPAYTRHTTELRLKPMTREQLARFVHHLVSANPGIEMDTFHLSFEGNQSVTPESLVLAYLVPTAPSAMPPPANPKR